MFSLQAQNKQAKPLKGEGVYAFLIRHNLNPSKHLNQFYELNKGKFTKKKNLLANVIYILPDGDEFIYEPLFGGEYAKFKLVSNDVKGAVLYLVAGHGGLDSGAIGKYKGHSIHEHEYAYDITLRLAKKLMENGAKVYVIIQDEKDGIRDDSILKYNNRGTCMGKKIPDSQKSRLRQRTKAVNKLYREKDKKSNYKRAISLHIDSRNTGQRIEVFYYHHKRSTKGKRLVTNMQKVFAEEYLEHQRRDYKGSVKTRSLYVINNMTPPVAFIELGNIRNPYDQKRFVIENNRQALANWLYEGIKRDYKQE